VLAHGDAAQLERPALLADRDEAEVGGAAAHVAHQHQVSHFHALAPGVARRATVNAPGLFEEATPGAGLRRRRISAGPLVGQASTSETWSGVASPPP
jgi:hypothetical protein